MATILLPALDDPDALDVLVSIHDITESMRVQEELDVAKKEVEANLETIKRDIAFGESVQRAILPPAFPVGSRYDIDGFMQAARTVGGDFYDFYVLDDDTIGFAIADVSGKGVPADLYLTVRLACHVEELSQREAARRFGYQDLFHIGLEGSPMHRPVEEHRGARPQRGASRRSTWWSSNGHGVWRPGTVRLCATIPAAAPSSSTRRSRR